MGDIYLNELKDINSYFSEKEIPVLGVPGNHEPQRYIEETGIINIHGKIESIKGLRIAGLGGCFIYKNDPDLCMMTDFFSEMLAKSIPKADILITHAPYKMDTNDPIHNGLQGISWYINEYAPYFHFYGHLHNRDSKTHKNGTRSFCVYQAMIFNTETEELKYLF